MTIISCDEYRDNYHDGDEYRDNYHDVMIIIMTARGGGRFPGSYQWGRDRQGGVLGRRRRPSRRSSLTPADAGRSRSQAPQVLVRSLVLQLNLPRSLGVLCQCGHTACHVLSYQVAPGRPHREQSGPPAKACRRAALGRRRVPSPGRHGHLSSRDGTSNSAGGGRSSSESYRYASSKSESVSRGLEVPSPTEPAQSDSAQPAAGPLALAALIDSGRDFELEDSGGPEDGLSGPGHESRLLLRGRPDESQGLPVSSTRTIRGRGRVTPCIRVRRVQCQPGPCPHCIRPVGPSGWKILL